MEFLPSFSQLLLVAVLAMNALLSMLVYRSGPRSATNILFVVLSMATSIWLVVIQRAIQPVAATALISTRLTVFFAVPQSVLFFLLAHTLPSEKLLLRRFKVAAIAASTIAMMAFTLSPHVFRDVRIMGDAVQSVPGPGMPFFALFTASFSAGAIYALIRKIRHASGNARRQIILMMWGIVLMLGLIIGTIMIPVMVFQNQAFIPFSPLYALLFLGMTAYSIVRYQLFDLKVIATEALTVILWTALLAKTFVASSPTERLIDALIFLIAFVFGMFLVRSVRKEVEQRRELEALTGELQAANKKLEELSRFKSQLLSLASHQLKSPLAVIKGFSSLLLDGVYGPLAEKGRETVLKIQKSADDLIELINNLLDLRRVEEGRMDYKFDVIAVNALLQALVESMKPLVSAKKLELRLKTPPQELFVSGDLQKLQEVFRNLLDNAVKYTPAGWIEVGAAESGGRVMIQVKDSGLGIPATLLPRLFEEFVRDERVRRKILGTGFGLYIAKKIVEAHGGRISAESAGEGRGSTFTVNLPEVPG